MGQPGPASLELVPVSAGDDESSAVDDSGFGPSVELSGMVEPSGGAGLPASICPLSVHSGVVAACPGGGQHTCGALVALGFGGVTHTSGLVQSLLPFCVLQG
jgi:hypothetical protein